MPVLSPSQTNLLRQTLHGVRQAPPPDAQRWCLADLPLGWLLPDHDAALARELADTVLSDGQRIWQAAAERLHA
jgi:hypothetical protein